MQRHTRAAAVLTAICSLSAFASSAAASQRPDRSPNVTVLDGTALAGLGSGSTLGPDGALYVTNGNEGTLVRIDVRSGVSTIVGSGLPPQIVGIGGAQDVAFLDGRAHVLVTLAGADVGNPDAVMGIYRLRDDGTFEVFADIGAWSAANPPADPDWFLSQGVQYSIETWRGGFVVADAHLGRIVRVGATGSVGELVAFPGTDAVPTGLEVSHGRVLVATAGPIPHLPSTSTIDVIERDGDIDEVAGWDEGYVGDAGLIVDVERGRSDRLYGLLQGHWDLDPIPDNEGLPAAPGTGEIVVADRDGSFTTVVAGIDQPTSFEIVGRTAYVVTLGGTILRIDGV
jgi:hypothetical protein